MKKYIFVTDTDLENSAVILLLMKHQIAFNYHPSSSSIIVATDNSVDFEHVMKISHLLNVKVNPYRE